MPRLFFGADIVMGNTPLSPFSDDFFFTQIHELAAFSRLLQSCRRPAFGTQCDVPAFFPGRKSFFLIAFPLFISRFRFLRPVLFLRFFFLSQRPELFFSAVLRWEFFFSRAFSKFSPPFSPGGR